MASGYGYNGGTSRCFEPVQLYFKCMNKTIFPNDCLAEFEDYFECLHHTKEVLRNREIRDTYLARVSKEAREARAKGEVRATSSILRLGIIGKGDESSSSSSSSGQASSGASGRSTDAGQSDSKGEGDKKE